MTLPECPACFTPVNRSKMLYTIEFNVDDEADDIQCDACEATFTIVRHVYYHYETRATPAKGGDRG